MLGLLSTSLTLSSTPLTLPGESDTIVTLRCLHPDFASPSIASHWGFSLPLLQSPCKLTFSASSLKAGPKINQDLGFPKILRLTSSTKVASQVPYPIRCPLYPIHSYVLILKDILILLGYSYPNSPCLGALLPNL